MQIDFLRILDISRHAKRIVKTLVMNLITNDRTIKANVTVSELSIL